MRIRHVIPSVGASAPAELVEAQDLTLRSVERALRYSDDNLKIDVRAVRFPDEPVERPWLTDMPILERSILDIGTFQLPRRLPLLPDVLAGFGDPSEYDVAILTNVDIALQPIFYDLVAELTLEGYDAMTITRRTVQPRFGGTSLARLAATGGTVHPGHDCFVMSPALVEQMDPGDVALGVRWVARTLLWQLLLFASRFRHFGDLHATFHVGDDRAWTNPRLDDFERHNELRAQELIERLVGRVGRERVSRLLSTAPLLEALDSGDRARNPPPRQRSFPTDARPMSGGSQRLVFSANSGRSGSGFLADLLGAAERTVSGHEREPTMNGPWLRRIAYEPRHASYLERLAKVDSLRAELKQMPPSWTYVDTSHMFVKTFADVVFDEFQHSLISVIVLRRDPVKVAKSFFELDYLGPRPLAWYDWILPPTAPFASFHIDAEEVEDQFDLIFGYLVDIESRAQALRDLTPGANWVDARLEDITTVSGATQLFASLQLRPPGDLADRVAVQVNPKKKPKSRVKQHVHNDFVRQRLTDFLHKYEERREVVMFAAAHGLTIP